ncbi:site-specific DNA-methyltransferase [uncultured Christiangramia sp.]|uniref:site-specific DNA-methyltransferase n=1 Tax=uncultured Christiangramia sp. TaxID=503836 RepID=UPI0026307DEF|nr:site-specific DNA-methyltransferase [uncultured Christiangramia sp.]
MIKDIETQNENKSVCDKEITILKEHFPACFSKDGVFDIERFKEAINDKVDITKEGYELKFLGKGYAKLLVSIDSTTVITPNLEHNKLPENRNSENIYISGDNLDGLQHLLKSYSNKVKCIYIDPPYNTGSDGFVYNDKFSFESEDLQRKLSVDEEEAQRILDLTNKGSASHSAWLLFMYPRLQLAKDLLTEDGVIFISIDDNEQANLKLLCNDIFGEENYEGHIHWRRRHNQPNDKTKLIGLVAEHILCFARNSIKLKESGVGKIALTGKFSNPDNDPKGDWATKPWKTGSDQSGTTYTITTPKGTSFTEEWMGEEATFKKLLDDNRIIFTKKGKGSPRKKYYKFEREDEGQCATNWWSHKSFGHNQEGNSELAELLDDTKNVFSNPKPTRLLNSLFKLSNVKEGDIIVDFFSGSASSADAILQTSAELKEKIKFISIQLPEILSGDNKDQKNAFNFLKSIGRPTTLDYVGVERIIRASKEIKEETKANIDYGFKHYILNEPKQNTLDKCETFDKSALIPDGSILEDFGVETVLTTWLNYDGYGLNINAQEIDLNGYTAYYYDKHLYLINPDFTKENVVALFEKYEAIGDFNPENVILFGYSFNEWSVTEMLEQNLKILNDTEKNLKININVRY